jgi:23S rRNA (uracil1939-C5)-methyltransferase
MHDPLTVVRLGAQGDGIAEQAGADVHVPGFLPGERVVLESDGGGRLIGPPSPERRAEPLCPHVPQCGGCAVQHMNDALYVRWKEALLAQALSHRGLSAPIAPVRIVPLASRRRATFAGSWHDGKARLGFHRAGTHTIEPIDACAVLRPAVVDTLPALAALAALLVPNGAPFRISVLDADNGLDVAIDAKMSARVSRQASGVATAMRGARIVRLTLAGEPFLMLAPPVVRIAGVEVMPPPAAFLQAARETDIILADLVLGSVGKPKRVADLFAGLGTLSLALAAKARVLSVDSDAALQDALRKAVAGTQGLKPVDCLRRDLFRDPLSPRELDQHDAVVLDPPRSGAAAQSEALARSKVPRVVMVSCNPATLARDLRTLVDGGYRLESATPVDQFLFTPHLEAVAVLRRA